VRLSLKTVNAELSKRGINALLGKGGDYFYFWSGEAADWLDRTVRVPTLHSLTLDQWIDEFRKLREKNRQIVRSVEKRPAKSAAKQRPKSVKSSLNT
jgi:hypothetical protein